MTTHKHPYSVCDVYRVDVNTWPALRPSTTEISTSAVHTMFRFVTTGRKKLINTAVAFYYSWCKECGAVSGWSLVIIPTLETGNTRFATTFCLSISSRVLPNNTVLLWLGDYGTHCITSTLLFGITVWEKNLTGIITVWKSLTCPCRS
jgi:hypothetical protein